MSCQRIQLLQSYLQYESTLKTPYLFSTLKYEALITILELRHNIQHKDINCLFLYCIYSANLLKVLQNDLRHSSTLQTTYLFITL